MFRVSFAGFLIQSLQRIDLQMFVGACFLVFLMLVLYKCTCKLIMEVRYIEQ